MIKGFQRERERERERELCYEQFPMKSSQWGVPAEKLNNRDVYADHDSTEDMAEIWQKF